MLVTLFLVVAVRLVSASRDLSSAVQRCTAGDTACLAKTITNILHSYPNGLPEVGLPSLDPCYIGNEKTNQGSGATSIKVSLFDGWIYGWSNATVTSVVGFGKDPRSTIFEMNVKVPTEVVSAGYSMNGRLLLVPIQGQGKAKLRFDDLIMAVTFKTSVISKGGEDYLKINKVLVNIKCKNIHVQFDNLFNNAALSQYTNNILNANSMLVFNEVRNTFGAARARVVEELIGPFFALHPYRTLFADDFAK